ncbi:hypothetical protein SAMN05421770_102126 [Granulicella rosea]|uniref:Uncharacterized protein n=1 Tax=Granulicella rosea TaxID=474952 RepID=A0A239GX03_9BACT|nr:hypothetical protein [Granulicella rosea]SNS73739.1 hypothetical protein SAMN05421770_102126 [Granulicella rosea]
MLILYAISLISFCALVWAAFAITRHIRLASSAAPKPSETATGSTKKKNTFVGNPGNHSKQPQPR